MKYEQKPGSGPAKTGNPNQTNRDPSDPRGERKDFREAGQEADPELDNEISKDDIKAPAEDSAKPPLHAGKSNSDQGQR